MKNIPLQFNMNPQEWEFEFQQRDVHPALMTDLWLRATRDQLSRQFKLPVKNPDYLFTSNYKGFIKSENKKEILKKLREEVVNYEYLEYILRRTIEVTEEFDQLMEAIAGQVSEKTSKAELANMWRKIEQKYLETVPWYWIPWYLTEENIISDRVKAGMEKYRAKIEEVIDFNTALGILMFPKKEAIFQREQRDFCSLVRMALATPLFKTDAAFHDIAQRYLDSYAWMKTYFLLPIEPLSFEGLLERVERAIASDALSEYDMQEKKKKEYADIIQKLKKVFDGDQTLLRAIDDASELAWVLTASVEMGVRGAAKALPFNKILAKNIGISYENWIHLTSDQIVASLRSELKISDETIHERIVGTAALMQAGTINWLWGTEANKFGDYVETGSGKSIVDIKEFKGQPAFRGKVTGIVRVAMTPKESNNLINGEILVTSMTSPDYVPAMRRAAAVVTNEGGLLSHAAIMSREFGKPCIVGTKIATTVLKTGDKVEVDADKGMIFILK